MPVYGIILLNLGGPDSTKNVEPFLYNLFSDPDIFKFPLSKYMQKIFARLISRIRSKKVSKYYLQIGGRSPILSYTLLQARNLERKLSEHINCKVYVGMRYWNPLIDEAIEKAIKDSVDVFVLVPLYPQYSFTTTGSSFKEFYRIYNRMGLSAKKVVKIRSYPDDELFIRAIVERIEAEIENFDAEDFRSFAIVFSAHSLPLKFVEEGDPYYDEVRKTYNAILEFLKGRTPRADVYKNVRTEIAFQSRVGPVKWLGPSTIETVRKLAKEGIKNILVVPISFVSDNIETLFELGIQLRDIAIESGVKKFSVVEALNDSETFIECLKNIILKAIKNEG